MNKKITALILAFILLIGTNAYAVPIGLWDGDVRVETLNAKGDVITEFDMGRKILDYLEIVNKESISGDGDVKNIDLLVGFAKITGLKYDDGISAKTVMEDLKSAKLLRENVSAAVISLPDVLYMASRITGWTEVTDNDATVFSQAKKAGLMRNISFSTGRNLTRTEAAQILYNTISVKVKKAKNYKEGVTYLDKETMAPLLESKYGIVLRQGIVTSVFGESLYNRKVIKPFEIEIDGVVYYYNENENQSGLTGREVAYFLDNEDNTVLFAEATANNTVYTVNYGTSVNFKNNSFEYELGDEEIEINVSSQAKVIYNGMPAGAYSAEIMKKYFGKGTNIVAVDNNGDFEYDVIFIRKWQSYTALYNASSEGRITFDHKLEFEGRGYIDVTPEERNTHITVLNKGIPADYNTVKKGNVISISASANETGDRYIIVELGSDSVTGVLGGMNTDVYVVDGVDYQVADEYLNALENIKDIEAPEIGQSYTFSLDYTGRIVNASVPVDYKYGYLVRVSAVERLEAKCTVKIFTADAEMIYVNTDEQVILHDENSYAGVKLDAIDFIKKIVELNEDYRTLIQYKLNGKGELIEVWLPIDNTIAKTFGTTGYPLTLDVTDIKGTYLGNVGDFRFKGSEPVFKVPADFKGEDGLYEIRSVTYNGSNADFTSPMDLYGVDDFNFVKVGVQVEDTVFNNYGDIIFVDRVVEAVDSNNDPGYKIYGTVGEQERTYMTTITHLESREQNGWYPKVKISELGYGDIIQVQQLNGQVSDFRVLSRVTKPGEDYFKRDTGTTVATPTSQLWFFKGNYVARKDEALKVRSNNSGVYVDDLFFMNSGGNIPAYIFDTEAKKIIKTSPDELVEGDKIVVYGIWYFAEQIYIIR